MLRSYKRFEFVHLRGESPTIIKSFDLPKTK